MSKRLHEIPFEDLLVAWYRMDEYQPDLIEMILDKLTPNNMNYRVVSKTFSDQSHNEKEKWYGTEYRKVKLEEVSFCLFQLVFHYLLFHYYDFSRSSPNVRL